jgi:hypothetical protein
VLIESRGVLGPVGLGLRGWGRRGDSDGRGRHGGWGGHRNGVELGELLENGFEIRVEASILRPHSLQLQGGEG